MSDLAHLREPEAFALGALDPDEMAAAAHHMAECAPCTREVEHFTAAAALLPYALDKPIHATSKFSSLCHARMPWAWGLLAAASLAAAIWGGQATLSGIHDRSVLAAERAVVQMIAARPLRETVLHPMSPVVESAQATLMVGHADGMKTAIVVSQLPPAPAHMSYRLWYQAAGQGAPGPQLMALPHGAAICVVPGDLADHYDHVGIVLMGEGKHTMLFDAPIRSGASPATIRDAIPRVAHYV
ncbi:MAG: hypothetical protein KGM44_05825 [bacterium]|nr:hypothetical protein [bacterium]